MKKLKTFEEYKYSSIHGPYGVSSQDLIDNRDWDQDMMKNSKSVNKVINELTTMKGFDPMRIRHMKSHKHFIKALEKILVDEYDHILNDYEKNLVIDYFVGKNQVYP